MPLPVEVVERVLELAGVRAVVLWREDDEGGAGRDERRPLAHRGVRVRGGVADVGWDVRAVDERAQRERGLDGVYEDDLEGAAGGGRGCLLEALADEWSKPAGDSDAHSGATEAAKEDGDFGHGWDGSGGEDGGRGDCE